MKGGIPMPCPGETAAWGHAICAVGYDDGLKITNTKCNVTTAGALLIRNSWGTGWGDKGYGWLPYDYVLKGHALDFWSILKLDWIETGQFELPVH
jgi:C1A family cysteine protease